MSEINTSQNHYTSYKEVLDYLYTSLPMFQRVGGAAYKKDLENTRKLCDFLNHPEHRFKSVHVAGTNGKGSSSHYLASILQTAGYKTGLYTSPHLKNFTERIKINGEEIPQTVVVDFINKTRSIIEQIKPSFFELTVGMAFDYFAVEQVDIAIVEVGMGGRLDSTNVIIPEVSLITNISLDHQQWLGNTLQKVAGEKAGIIKEYIPVVISERQEELEAVFIQKSKDKAASIYFASDLYRSHFEGNDLIISAKENHINSFYLPSAGHYQTKNVPGVLATIDQLNQRGFMISNEHIKIGIEKMELTTGLKGRWQILSREPIVVCDVAHNLAGVQYILEQIASTPHESLYIIWGSVNDKDITKVLEILPKTASYYFCQANIPRALSSQNLHNEGRKYGLAGEVIPNVNEAIMEAKRNAGPNDMIYIGGSNFVVAEIDDL